MSQIESIDDPILKQDSFHSNSKGVKQSFLWALYIVLMVMSIVTLCLTVTTLIILSTKLNDITYIETTTPILPNSYVIPENRITPVSGQLARGTCWIFATISLVESAFRKAAIDNKMIKSNEYIALSDQAYGKLMLQLCNGTYGDVPDEVSSFCEDGGMAKGKTDDGEIEWAYYFRNYNNKFFYPISVCPYTTRRGETDWDCDGVDLKNPTKQTPITVNVKGLNSKYTPSSIKQLINDTQGPVGWGHATLGRTYMYPCDGKSPYSNGQDCLEQRFPCNGGFCTKVSTLSFGYDGIFRLNGEPTNRGGHAMNIVGWNDEYLGGGFIIKNSWTSQSGHSLGYFMGNHSLFNEDQICPTYNSINKWIPMGADCFKNNQDPEACPNITRTLLGNPLKGATVLKCTSSNSVSEVASEKAKDYGFYPCSTEEGKAYYYTLEASDDVNASPYVPKVEYPEGTDGYAIFNLIRWLPNGESSFEKIQTNYTTWQFMERLFTPSNIQNFMNSEHCGYYFMSYDVFLEHDLRHPLGGHDTYVFSSVDLNFDSKSFNNKADYKDSTFEYQLPTFTGSLDFN